MTNDETNRGTCATRVASSARVREATLIADSLRREIETGRAPDSTFIPPLAARGLAEYFGWVSNAQQSVAWLDRGSAVSPESDDFWGIASGLYGKVRNDRHFQAGVERIRAQTYDRVQGARRAARRLLTRL